MTYEADVRADADLAWLVKYEQETRQYQWLDDEEPVESMVVETAAAAVDWQYQARMQASQDFCLHQLAVPLAKPSRCLPELERCAGWVKRERLAVAERMLAPLALEQKKEIFYVKSSESETVLQFQFANFVTVTYLGNAATGEDYNFNLHALAQQLLPYYAEYRKKKFAKVNLRLRDGGSHMIYGSAIIVESGSDCTATSKALLKLTMRILRHQCGYRQLIVQRRCCFNIVATGNVRGADGQQTSLCLGLLKHLFPNASYKKDKFSGVIIKLTDVEKHLSDQAYHAGLDFVGAEYEYAAEYDSDDDDSALIAEINSECEMVTPPTAPVSHRGNGRRAKIEKVELLDDDERDAKRNATLEEFAHLATKKENGTFLIFKEGQIICTGCKSKRRLLGAYEKIYWLLAQCTATAENLAWEKAHSKAVK